MKQKAAIFTLSLTGFISNDVAQAGGFGPRPGYGGISPISLGVPGVTPPPGLSYMQIGDDDLQKQELGPYYN